MQSYFHKLFLYTGWANREVIHTLAQHEVTDEYSIRIMSHVIHAQFIWLERIIPHSYPFKLWDMLSFEQMERLSDENKQLWLDYLANISTNDFAQVITYSNISGERFETALVDIMAHVVNHATYHRAQIAKAFRGLGIAPPNTDYITYCRKFDHIEQT